MPGTSSPGLADLVLALADCKTLLGMRYAEWSSATPTLEADIAAAAMGLDDLGHSRVLYGCLPELGDPREPARDTDPGAWRNVAFVDESWTSWSQFVAANAILDTAFTLTIEALVEGESELLRTRLRKMLSEERYHFLHGRSWLREGPGEEALERAWEEAVTFFGPPDQMLAGTQLNGGDLAQRLEERLRWKGSSLPAWEGWDPRRRRLRPGAIDSRTFEMLTGLLEKRYSLAGTRGDEA